MPRETDLKFLLSRPDPALNFRWVTDLIPFGLPPSYLESIDLPFSSVDIKEGVYAGSSFNYFPGFHNISSVNMGFYEDDCSTTMQWLYKWKGKIKDLGTGIYNLPEAYKRPINLILIDAKGNDHLQVTLQGIWPAATANYSLSYTESGRIVVNQTFSVDSQELKFYKAPKLLANAA